MGQDYQNNRNFSAQLYVQGLLLLFTILNSSKAEYTAMGIPCNREQARDYVQVSA